MEILLAINKRRNRIPTN